MLSFAQQISAFSAAVAHRDALLAERAAQPSTADVKRARANASQQRQQAITAYLQSLPAKSRWTTVDQLQAATGITKANLVIQTLITLRKRGICVSRQRRHQKAMQWSLA